MSYGKKELTPILLRVEAFNTAGDQRPSFLLKAESCRFFPSPNGELVAIFAEPQSHSTTDHDTIYIVNAKAEVVAKVEIKE